MKQKKENKRGLDYPNYKLSFQELVGFLQGFLKHFSPEGQHNTFFVLLAINTFNYSSFSYGSMSLSCDLQLWSIQRPGNLTEVWGSLWPGIPGWPGDDTGVFSDYSSCVKESQSHMLQWLRCATSRQSMKTVFFTTFLPVLSAHLSKILRTSFEIFKGMWSLTTIM